MIQEVERSGRMEREGVRNGERKTRRVEGVGLKRVKRGKCVESRCRIEESEEEDLVVR